MVREAYRNGHDFGRDMRDYFKNVTKVADIHACNSF